MKENLLKIINHYGVLPQLKHFNSEVFELNEARFEKEKIGAYPGIEERKHIAEEIADVSVMLNQFKEYYGITDESSDFIVTDPPYKLTSRGSSETIGGYWK